nr:glutathione s-transferase t3 [Quercus suber]
MDSQNPFFLDILQDKEQDEDIKLVSAWLNVSLDAVLSIDQKHTTFWNRIWSTFHNDKKFNHSKDSLNSQWSTIQKETNKFYGYLAQIENRNEIGKTEHDKINDAKTMYKSNSKNAFEVEHCWRILRNEAKWLNLRDNVKVCTKQPATQSCHTFVSSINLDENNDKMNSGETLERPIGKKAEKEKLKKRKNCDDVVPILSTQLDDIKEENRRMHKEKKESSKKRKLGDEKAEASFPNPSVHVTPPSLTPSLEVTAVTPPVTRASGKSKIGMSVWDDPATALGCAHNVITSDELKSLLSVPSHELVSRHIHKLVQVCHLDFLTLLICYGMCTTFFPLSLRITTDYLSMEEKIVMASSKAESVKAECSQLKKDLITAMNERNEANQRVKELTESLRVEKALVIQKDEEIQVALLKTDEERENVIQKFKQSEEFLDLQFLQYFKGFELLSHEASQLGCGFF